MTAVQLQLNLWQRLEQAQASPEATDWRQLCLAFDEAIDQTPVELRLATAADAIEQMSDLLLATATAWAIRRQSSWRVKDSVMSVMTIRKRVVSPHQIKNSDRYPPEPRLAPYTF